MKFYISILCLNRLHATVACLESLFANSGGEDYFVRVTNNASTDNTKQFLDSLNRPNVQVVHNETNEGFVGPNNLAFRDARKKGAKYFIALNNDTTPPANWLNLLTQRMEHDPDVALCGPEGTCCSLSNDFHGYGGSQYEYVEGSCLCAKVEKLAQWPDFFSDYVDFIYGDDSDLSLRVREKGMTIHRASFFMPHTRGETVQRQPEVKARCDQAQARNHIVLKQRWAHYLQVRNFRYPIVVRRSFALGDALLTTPIIRAIKESNPLSDILVDTDNPYIFQGNPNVKEVGRNINGVPGSLTVDLNMAYENRPMMHIIDAYAQQARDVVKGLGEVDYRTELFPGQQDFGFSGSLRNSICGPYEKLCLFHCDHGDWPGKNWPHDRFQNVINQMHHMGWKCAIIGNKGFNADNAANWRGRTSLLQMAALMKFANLFIGVDSFPMHAAQAMGCPTIGIFGVTSPRFIMTTGSPHIGVSGSGHECCGKRHHVGGTTRVDCSPDCINSVSVEMVMEAVRKLI